MPRWKELPAEISSSERQLLVQLRRLKDHSDLSLASLAGRTSYSRSSWERYLNGKKPVPRKAVEELARVCGTEPTRLLVLYDVAERSRPRTTATGRTDDSSSASPESARPLEPAREADPEPEPEPGQERETASATAPEPEPGPTPTPIPEQRQSDSRRAESRPSDSRRPGRTVPLGWLVAAVVLAVAVSFGAGLLTARAWDDDAPAKKKTGPVAAGTGYLRGQTYECAVQRKDGRLRAGHSDTREMLLDINSTGFDVVEAQCLLREKGFDPGVFDGLYDERTKGAAKKFQQARHLVVDGIIGPDTWRELRR
ncbi:MULTISPECIES: helix-turn-helix domain-containing protein [unclassified Streptomyces]|uniref:helix-turn-helix domain-containing protein n=1 Tax=unclassified Streptomyces TaxID=2593676 RepID=UPI0011E79431|nr:helix-turn-helix domain-containing protein [Streptomyces sp. sk2.1]TXS74432.1 peptidoglycan-binding protein [Streptomyces sp. sk2.1]